MAGPDCSSEDCERVWARYEMLKDKVKLLESRLAAAERLQRAAYRYFINPKVDNSFEIREALARYDEIVAKEDK